MLLATEMMLLFVMSFVCYGVFTPTTPQLISISVWIMD